MGYGRLGRNPGGLRKEMMRQQIGAAVIGLVLLASCQGPAKPSIQLAYPEPPTATAAASTSQPVPTRTEGARPGALFFDAFYMVDDNDGWAWAGDGRLYRTTDAGSTWNRIEFDGRLITDGDFFLNSEQAWVNGLSAEGTHATFHTTDGGETWSQLATLESPNIDLYFHDSLLGWARIGVAPFTGAFKTVNGGKAWERMQLANPGTPLGGKMSGSLQLVQGSDVGFSAPDTVWVTPSYDYAKAYVRLLMSVDGGVTWQNKDLPLPSVPAETPVSLSLPQFVSDSTAFVAATLGDKVLFFVSQDAGESWRRLPATVDGKFLYPEFQFASASDGFALCGTGLCATHDGGMSWRQVILDFPYAYAEHFGSQWQFVNGSRGWAILKDASGAPRFMTTRDGGVTWSAIEPQLK